MGTTSRFDRLPIDDVQLDLKNPRIAKWVEMYGDNINAEQMSLALGAADPHSDDSGTTFASLRESIRTNGGIIHPILVNKEASGRLVAIEGNTRVLIYREFNQGKAEGDWQTIPAMIFDDLPPQEIDAIRLQSHLVGPRAWDPYSKAKYLDLLSNSKHLTLAQIVDFCGGRQREVQDYIAAYQDMEKHYRPLLDSDDQLDASRFSAFVEVQRPRIREALLTAKATLTDFSKWVKDGLIYPLNTVRQLPRILKDSRSRDIFLRDGAQEALKVLDVPTPDAALKEAPLDQLARELVRRINGLPWSSLQRLKADKDGAEMEMLHGLSVTRRARRSVGPTRGRCDFVPPA